MFLRTCGSVRGSSIVIARTTAVILMAAGAAAAQPSATPTAGDGQALKLRYQIRVMEGVLERTVEHAAQLVNQRMQSFAPDMVLLSGAARVRGFRLEGYGVFFDVDVPALRQSVSWSIRTLRQNNLGAEQAIDALRRLVEAQRDQAARVEFEQALKLLELRVGPLPSQAAHSNQGTTVAAPDASTPQVVVAGPLPADQDRAVADAPLPPPGDDPGDLYTSEVQSALVDAMLDYSAPIAIGPDEWLVVAARDNGDLVAPGDTSEAVTIVLRLAGRDLLDLRAARLTRSEARARVEVRLF